MSRQWQPYMLSVMRMIVGFLFVVHGTQKLFGFPVPGPGGIVDWTSMAGAAGMIETVGGTLLLIGLLTRPIAFILAGEMAFAYFMMHASKGFWPMLNGGELAVLYCFAFLYLWTAGGGAWSVDAVLHPRLKTTVFARRPFDLDFEMPQYRGPSDRGGHYRPA